MAGMAIRTYIRNFAQVRSALNRLDRRYRGAMANTIKAMLLRLRNYASFITHRETGTLARSHSIEYDARRMVGYIYPSPRYYKMQGRRSVSAADYAWFEHSRGGEHAFYERALREMGPRVGFDGINSILAVMPRGINDFS